MSKKTKHYILKKGVRMSYILNGEPVNLLGDGKGTVELNDGQAEAFKDKFQGESDDAVDFDEPVLAGGQSLDGSDINQAAEEGMASNDEAGTAEAVAAAKEEGSEKAAGNDKAPAPVGGAVKK